MNPLADDQIAMKSPAADFECEGLPTSFASLLNPVVVASAVYGAEA